MTKTSKTRTTTAKKRSAARQKPAPKKTPPPCDHLIPLSEKMQARLKEFDQKLSEIQRQANSIQGARNSFIEGLLFAQDIENPGQVRISQDGKVLLVDLEKGPDKVNQ